MKMCTVQVIFNQNGFDCHVLDIYNRAAISTTAKLKYREFTFIGGGSIVIFKKVMNIKFEPFYGFEINLIQYYKIYLK